MNAEHSDQSPGWGASWFFEKLALFSACPEPSRKWRYKSLKSKA
jgi:hypothetical protein